MHPSAVMCPSCSRSLMYLTPPIVICPLAFMGLSAVVYPPCCPAPQMPPSSATMGGLGVPKNIIMLTAFPPPTAALPFRCLPHPQLRWVAWAGVPKNIIMLTAPPPSLLPCPSDECLPPQLRWVSGMGVPNNIIKLTAPTFPPPLLPCPSDASLLSYDGRPGCAYKHHQAAAYRQMCGAVFQGVC